MTHVQRLRWGVLLAGALCTAQAQEPDAGTTIVGERDTALGLYLSPWQDERADPALDFPPGLLDEPLAPIDPQAFALQVQEYEARVAYRRELLQRVR